MPLPCRKCGKRTVEIKQYEVKRVDFEPPRTVTESVVEARCNHCLWNYREVEVQPQPSS